MLNGKRLVNATAHDVDIESMGIKLEPSGVVARVEEVVDATSSPVVVRKRIIDLPEPEEGVIFVVSRKVAEAAACEGLKRDDLVFPFIVSRNDHGNITGCKYLAKMGVWDGICEEERARDVHYLMDEAFRRIRRVHSENRG